MRQTSLPAMLSLHSPKLPCAPPEKVFLDTISKPERKLNTFQDKFRGLKFNRDQNIPPVSPETTKPSAIYPLHQIRPRLQSENRYSSTSSTSDVSKPLISFLNRQNIFSKSNQLKAHILLELMKHENIFRGIFIENYIKLFLMQN